ncbi:max dimerization protein 3 isoform X3 [Pantherophis guttatus]|uniref:Max dimerization protein 3 n=1 Tax=Pantherophis guttatus TaxID=94885 RepID=A0A6P9E0R7_PANGU|nr:max dimerization protein 3 isoform X3 [Pantherophis guttatus]
MELTSSNIQVLLQAADYLERRERAEHGYASLSPYCGPDALQSQRRPKTRKALRNLRSVHNELEKHSRRAQLRQCLEQLKQQIPTNTERSRYTMLSLLHCARLHIKKLEHQEQKAQEVKERLRCKQQNLHQRLEELQAHLNMEKAEADSLDSSRFSSEHSDSEEEVDVEGLASASIGDVMAAFSTQQEHSYSNVSNFWLWTEVQLGGQHSSRQASSFPEITLWQGN